MDLKLFVTLLLLLLSNNLKASNSEIEIDSLLDFIITEEQLTITSLEEFSDLIKLETDPMRTALYADKLLGFAHKLDSKLHLIKGNIYKGNGHRINANFEKALEAYYKALNLCSGKQFDRLKGIAEFSIADVFSNSGNSTNALKYYDLALKTLLKTNDTLSIATVYLNAGDEYLSKNEYEKSIGFFLKSVRTFKQIDSDEGIAFNYGNLGMAYASTGKKKLAEEYMNKAIDVLEELKLLYPISVYLNYLADIYVGKGDLSQALKYSKRSLYLAKQHALKKEIGDAHLKLSELYELSNKDDEAYHHYKQHIVYRDSVYNVEQAEVLANQRTDFEVSQKQAELNLTEEKRKSQQIISRATGGIALLIGFLAFLLFRNNKYIKKTSEIIKTERDKSEKLLLNILPEKTAQELKNNGKVAAKHFEEVSVLFADFVGFTKYAEQLSPDELVQTIDQYFTKFDEIMSHYGLEKIKTIGDAYMCASGLPSYTEDHTIKMVKAATEMVNYVEQETLKYNLQNTMNIRVGINTGPVVAGVVGSSKFAYDIWGDTVNTASRLESHSLPGRINISDSTHHLVKDHFICEKRDPIEVKSKGYIDMYFVTS